MGAIRLARTPLRSACSLPSGSVLVGWMLTDSLMFDPFSWFKESTHAPLAILRRGGSGLLDDGLRLAGLPVSKKPQMTAFNLRSNGYATLPLPALDCWFPRLPRHSRLRLRGQSGRTFAITIGPFCGQLGRSGTDDGIIRTSPCRRWRTRFFVAVHWHLDRHLAGPNPRQPTATTTSPPSSFTSCGPSRANVMPQRVSDPLLWSSQ